MKTIEYVEYKELNYNNEIIPYELIRTKIKNMYIYIKNQKVIVKVPIKIANEKINSFINKKAKWIYNNIKKETQKVEEKIEEKDIQKLKSIVNKSIIKYSKILKTAPKQVTIKNIKYAWGSCSSKKNISINMKLANKNEKAIEYVVLHEMCHLKQMNHSKKFWELVEKNMPEYQTYKKMLKE